jgi:hypothetical protein
LIATLVWSWLTDHRPARRFGSLLKEQAMKTYILTLSLPLFIACTGGDTGKDTSGADTGTADGGSGGSGGSDGSGTEGTGGTEGTDGTEGSEGTDGTDGGEPLISGAVSGTVRVQLYSTDEDGERVYLDMASLYGDSFPFGRIFVGATDATSGALVGDTYIGAPSVGGDPYTVTVYMSEAGPVNLYAAVDYSGDTVIHSYDPTGVHPASVLVEEGSSSTGADIVILAPWPGDGSGGGGGGGESCTEVTISGPVTVNQDVSSTSGMSMLLGTDGSGPWDWAAFTTDGTAEGSGGSYELPVCSSAGELSLVGALDTNANGLFDPGDTWGTYVTAPDTTGNPIWVGTTDLNPYELQIPIGGGDSPIAIVPFVRMTTSLTMRDGGTFDSLPAGSTVHLAAFYYRPSPDLSVASISSNSYDYEEIPWSSLSGQSSVDVELILPSNVVAYLWAFVDVDADGVVNEAGEPLGSSLEDTNGKVTVGSSNFTTGVQLGTLED